MALERSRRLKYNPAVDFYRLSTKVYETVKRSFSTVLVSFECGRERWHPGETFRCGLWVATDRAEAFSGRQT